MTCTTPPRFRGSRHARTDSRAANKERYQEVSSAPRRCRGFYSKLLPSRTVRNPLKTNNRCASYPKLNRGVGLPCFLASLPPCVRIARHTMSGYSQSISLKTKKSDPRRVTHKIKSARTTFPAAPAFPQPPASCLQRPELSLRTTDSLVTRSSPRHTRDAAPCYPYLVTRRISSSLLASRRGISCAR